MSFSMMSLLLGLAISPASAGTIRGHGGGASVHVTLDPWSPSFRPSHRPGYTWVSGHYDTDGHWVPGHWMPTMMRAGYHWVTGYWRGAHYTEGYWRKGSRSSHVVRSSGHVDGRKGTIGDRDHGGPSVNAHDSRSGGRSGGSVQPRGGRSDGDRPNAGSQRNDRGGDASNRGGSGGQRGGGGSSGGGKSRGR